MTATKLHDQLYDQAEGIALLLALNFAAAARPGRGHRKFDRIFSLAFRFWPVSFAAMSARGHRVDRRRPDQPTQKKKKSLKLKFELDLEE